ncbi:MAG: sterol desaturase family protein [Myxococcota bacterium]
MIAGWWALGVLGFTFIEYVHHRHGGHLRKMGPRVLSSHRDHHADPLDGGATYVDKLRYRAPLVLGVLVVLAVPALALLGAWAGSWLSAGLLSGYLYSEWFHNRMHHVPPRGPWARFMARYHYVHHFVDPSVNYGFTSPLWDFVFGTAKLEAKVSVPRTMAPRGMTERDGFTLVGPARSTSDPR